MAVKLTETPYATSAPNSAERIREVLSTLSPVVQKYLRCGTNASPLSPGTKISPPLSLVEQKYPQISLLVVRSGRSRRIAEATAAESTLLLAQLLPDTLSQYWTSRRPIPPHAISVRYHRTLAQYRAHRVGPSRASSVPDIA
eukprot:2630010-Rhodomonas_salina.1